jgi:hypothetical protein
VNKILKQQHLKHVYFFNKKIIWMAWCRSGKRWVSYRKGGGSNNYNSLLAQLTPDIGSKATQKKHESNTYTNNNYHTQTNKKAVSQYNKCNQVSPVLSSKDRLIKEPKDFTCCEEVGLRIFSILSISFNVLILDRYWKLSRKAVLNLLLICTI